MTASGEMDAGVLHGSSSLLDRMQARVETTDRRTQAADVRAAVAERATRVEDARRPDDNQFNRLTRCFREGRAPLLAAGHGLPRQARIGKKNQAHTMKLTIQRMLVARTVRHAGGHVTAGQIVAELRASQPALDVSTVYRTLAALEKHALVTQTSVGSGELIERWTLIGDDLERVASKRSAAKLGGA